MKMEKNTIFFLAIAIILFSAFILNADPNNFYNDPFGMLLFVVVCFFAPLLVVLIMNKIVDIQKTEKAKKILKLITSIINILLFVYVASVALILYAVIITFD